MILPESEGWVWMFPGHGGQFVGMSRGLFRNHEHGRDALAQAEAFSGLPLRQFLQHGPAEELRRPEVLEPILAATSIAYVEILSEAGHRPDAVAGYSAGELGALYAAGVLSRPDVLKAALWRGEILRGAAARQPGGMQAVLRLSIEQVERVVAMGKGDEDLGIAADNAPNHVTLTGFPAYLERAASALSAMGGEVHPVEVGGPWHGPWLADASARLLQRLSDLRFHPPIVPIHSSVTGRVEADPGRLRVLLAAQFREAVRWRAVVDDLHARGRRNFLEVGAGRVLRDFLRRNPPNGIPDQLEGLEGHHGGDAPLRRWASPSPDLLMTPEPLRSPR